MPSKTLLGGTPPTPAPLPAVPVGHPVPHLGLPQLRGTRGVRAVVPSLSRRLLPSLSLPSVFLPSPRPQDSQSCDAALRDFVPGQFPAIVAVRRASRSSQKLMGAMCSLVRCRLAGEEFPNPRAASVRAQPERCRRSCRGSLPHRCLLASALKRGDIFVHLKRPRRPWLQPAFLIPVPAHASLYFSCQLSFQPCNQATHGRSRERFVTPRTART